ncbi:hypothetical protein SRABI98_00042 [Microbacterium sp. Bi98]|uniref:hypothetical protein n=1 Tax=Microbacterium sp. Bi98 TaxID=2821116 RepID=UPI001D24242E|nr:hypothetical protein [Microbacterium sp. Bi98]CAH0123845.1 hypothetical protein SRABI98_00042 [Microbacterium sp. Bi98]
MSVPSALSSFDMDDMQLRYLVDDARLVGIQLLPLSGVERVVPHRRDLDSEPSILGVPGMVAP